jgi:predicted P-loop ATPase
VRVGTIDLEALEHDRDQLLAEAMHLFQEGSPWWPDRDFEAEFIAPEQVARYEEDPWQETIENWISGSARVRASISEIMKEVLYLPVGQFGTREQRRVHAILSRMGWTSMRIKNKRFYEAPPRVAKD